MTQYMSQNVKEYIKKFQTDGFVIVPDMIPLEEINIIYEPMFLLLQKYFLAEH